MILLVDGYNVYARSAAKLGHLKRASDGFTTGGLFGFIRSVQSVEKRVGSTWTCIAMEGGGAPARQVHDPFYKADRIDRESFWIPEHLEAIEIWALLSGRTLLRGDGLEADDCIAAMVREDRNVAYAILSEDHDMRALLDTNNLIVRADGSTYTHGDFVAEFGFSPDLYHIYLALVGDHTDNVPGVTTTSVAKEIVPNNQTLVQWLDETSEQNRERFQLNCMLVSFLSTKTSDFIIAPQKDFEALHDFYDSWEFVSLSKKLAEEKVA